MASPLRPAFRDFLQGLERRCLICSPYVTMGPIRQLIEVVRAKGIQDRLDLRVLTDISLPTLLTGSTDINALILLTETVRQTEVMYLPRIHAKVYVSDETAAIVGSANFTNGGFSENLEYAIRLSDPLAIRRVANDIEQYARLGSKVADTRLRQLGPTIDDLRFALSAEQRTIDQKLRQASAELQVRTEEELLRTRIAGRTVHAIFSETIEYVLEHQGLTTEDIHQRVREIHPDLCDDTVDRVIDGERFGRLWKHQIRTAQQHLKRSGRIAYDEETRLWRKLT